MLANNLRRRYDFKVWLILEALTYQVRISR